MLGLASREARGPGRWVLALGLVLVVGLLWWAGRVGWTALQAKQDAQAAQAALRAVQARPTDPATLAAAGAAAEALARSLSALQAEVRPVGALLALARPLPATASWLADVPDVLAVSAPLAQIGATASRPLLAAVLRDDGSQGRLPALMTAADELVALGPELERQLGAVEAPLARLRGRPLGGPLQEFEPVVGQLGDALPAARQAVHALAVLRPALGWEGPRTYLLLGQNRAELCATGGFIGTLGTFTVDRGVVAQFEYGSSYLADAHVEPPPPPAPLARHLGLGGWYLRDANWWPDFPATAAQVDQAWQRAGHPPIDGVIAIDNRVVEAILRAVGRLDVPGYGAVDADSFERVSVQELYTPGPAAPADGTFHDVTAAFFSAFGRALQQRLLALSPAEAVPIAKELLTLLDRKHVQLAFKDPRLIAFVHERGWDGGIDPVAGDSLYVVDTTVSYGKTHRFVRSRVALEVALHDDGRVVHDLTLSYTNAYPDGLAAWMPAAMIGGEYFDATAGRMVDAPGFWGNWLRLYLPPDAREVVVSGLREAAPPQDEFGRTLVAGYLPLSPGEERVVVVRYVTGGERQAAPAAYRLFVHKQAGTDCRPLTLAVQWPSGATGSTTACPTADTWIAQNPRGPRG